MAYTKAAHHKGSHQVRARRIVQAANANPNTRCWRCDRTMDEIRQQKPKARWTGGHLIDGLKDGPMAAECSPCNFAAGARLGNTRRAQPRRTRLTW